MTSKCRMCLDHVLRETPDRYGKVPRLVDTAIPLSNKCSNLLYLVSVGSWCNDSTTGFDPVSLGLIPSGPSIILTQGTLYEAKTIRSPQTKGSIAQRKSNWLLPSRSRYRNSLLPPYKNAYAWLPPGEWQLRRCLSALKVSVSIW
jgi:hypothetical protein